MGIKLKISLIANFIAIICLLVLGITTFFFVKNALFEEITEAETNYLKSTKNLMIDFRQNASDSVKKLSKIVLEHPYSDLENEASMVKSLGAEFKAFRDASGFLAVYIGAPNGELITSDPRSDEKKLNAYIYGKANNYDATTRGWYKGAKEKNGIFISDIYIDVATNLPCFTYAMPLYKNGKFIGILGIDILLTDLQNKIERLPGTSFIFDKSNYVFASANKAFLGNNTNIPNVLKGFSSVGDFQPFHYTRIQGGERFAMCTTEDAYTICISESLDKIEEAVYDIATIQSVIVIIIITISIILLYFIISRYLSPLEKIQSGLNS
ncbi:methyl-accepting chemotaxis protein, partial [Campylobacter volucris]